MSVPLKKTPTPVSHEVDRVIKTHGLINTDHSISYIPLHTKSTISLNDKLAKDVCGVAANKMHKLIKTMHYIAYI